MSEQNNKHSRNCLIFAHRGLHSEVLENTRGAFDKALEYAIDGIETDVQLSRDAIAVLWHDRFLDKIGLADQRIDDYDYAQLKMLINPQSESEGILTLQDFLAKYRARSRLLIEVKNRDWETVSRHELKIRQTLRLINASQGQPILVSSFHLASLVYAHQLQPTIPLIYNIDTNQTFADAQYVLTSHPFLHGFCLPIQNLDHSMVDWLRDQDRCIAAYTCNSEAEISKALELEVDILISDLPQKALMLRNS